jgi:hypothetical protein
VSAHGSGAPPMFDAITADTSIGIIGSLILTASCTQIKVNSRITLRLFIKSDVAYMVTGSIIAINIFLPFDIW